MAEKIYQLIERTASQYPNKITFRRRKGNVLEGRTFSQIKDLIDNTIAGFISKKIERGEKIAFFCDSSPNWIVVDMSILSAGCVTVPRGTDVTVDDILYIINHSECTIAIVQKEKDKKRLESIADKIPILKNIFILEDDNSELSYAPGSVGELMEVGKELRQREPDCIHKRVQSVNPGELATLIYTSGTTGAPKGVMLNQSGWITAISHTVERMHLGSEDSAVSLLPPWHAFERALEYAIVATGLDFVVTDAKVLKEDLALFHPTVFPSVPRIWESLYNGIMAKISKESPIKQTIFKMAMEIGAEWANQKSKFYGYDHHIEERSQLSIISIKIASGISLIFLFPLKLLADLIFAPIHQALGGQLRISVSAGSALPSVVDKFLTSIGLRVLEGYGMTETSAVVAVRNPEFPMPGTLGTPLTGYQIKLKDDKGIEIPNYIGKKGTLWIKSDQILKGYYKRPELNKEVFDTDGFFNTGDLMTINWKGELIFSGRSKDTLVLAGGENIEPLPIEDKLLESQYIDQVLVVGNERKTLGVIIVPNFEKVKSNLSGIMDDTKTWNSDTKVRSLFKNEIQILISQKNGFKSFEQIPGNCFHISSRQFDPDTEMTRTLKVKRNIVTDNFSAEIDKMYKI
jgi:long-chain acyl-CoA synthetase